MNYFEIFFYYFFTTFFIISVVVFIHEMGHFLTARYFKFPVKTFSVGFGRELLGYTDRKGTRWKLSIFPIGGFVIIDETGQKLRHRFLVTLAGPLANFLFFFLLLIAAYAFIGNPVSPKVITGLSIKAHAIEGGLKLGDTIIKIDHIDVPDEGDVFKKTIQDYKKDTIPVTIIRGTTTLTKDITISTIKDRSDFGVPYDRRRLGVLFSVSSFKLADVNSINKVDVKNNETVARQEIIKHLDRDVVINIGKDDDAEDVLIHPKSSLNADLHKEGSRDYGYLRLADTKLIEHKEQSLQSAISLSHKMFLKVISINSGQIYQLIFGDNKSEEAAGIVKVGEMTGRVASHTDESGYFAIILVMAILSAEIGFFNLLPIPPLDGGNIVFYVVEAIRKKPASEKISAYINGGALVILLLIIFLVNAHNLIDMLFKK